MLQPLPTKVQDLPEEPRAAARQQHDRQQLQQHHAGSDPVPGPQARQAVANVLIEVDATLRRQQQAGTVQQRHEADEAKR
ncbi:MAG TPA: hypothetical protein PKI03_37155, partial [Pseudomonadota bacterium]|nr:hypothetical protein [Pseudomonadota bacterium]